MSDPRFFISKYRKIILIALVPVILVALSLWALASYIPQGAEFVQNWGWVVVIGIMIIYVVAVVILTEVRSFVESKPDKEKVAEAVEKLRAMRRKCIKIYPNELNIPTPGCSKVGGLPDVPEGFTWPVDDYGTPMIFCMQLHCPDLADYDPENHYPHEGMLYFFGSYEGGKVIYTPDTNNLHRAEPPADMDFDDEKSVWFKVGHDYPEIVIWAADTLSHEEREMVAEQIEDYYDEDSWGYLGGYEGGVWVTNKNFYEELDKNRESYEILLCCCYWLEVKYEIVCFNFFITHEDLRQRNFDNVICAWQD